MSTCLFSCLYICDVDISVYCLSVCLFVCCVLSSVVVTNKRVHLYKKRQSPYGAEVNVKAVAWLLLSKWKRCFCEISKFTVPNLTNPNFSLGLDMTMYTHSVKFWLLLSLCTRKHNFGVKCKKYCLAPTARGCKKLSYKVSTELWLSVEAWNQLNEYEWMNEWMSPTETQSDVLSLPNNASHSHAVFVLSSSQSETLVHTHPRQQSFRCARRWY